MSGRHLAEASLIGKAGGEATFKPASCARQRAYLMPELLGCFKANLKQAHVASAPVHWTFGGSIHSIIDH